MDDIATALDAIFADTDLDREDAVRTKAEVIEDLYARWGWEVVRDRMMSVLEDRSRPLGDWQTVAIAFWGAVLDHRSMSIDRLIALLYKRLLPDEGSGENNLAWSITSTLKGKSYLSDYDPLEDPGVRREFETL